MDYYDEKLARSGGSMKACFICMVGIILLLIVSLLYNYKQYRDLQEQPVKTVEKTVIKYTEKKDSMPEAKKETVIRYIKVPIKADSAYLDSIWENKQDSICLEVTQKMYTDDSTYTAWVSGYEPQLDSIFVRQKEILHSIIETRTVATKKFRRWNLGLIGGYGYGFQSKQVEPFVGLGITISLLP